MQSTNEELETSNEELQSTNEELITVNEELQVNSSELTIMSEELESILQNIGPPLLVVDSALKITNASATAVALFGMISPKDHPHLSQCVRPDGFPDLTTICDEVLRLGRETSKEFQSNDKPYLLRCEPFTNGVGKMIGATMILVELPPRAD